MAAELAPPSRWGTPLSDRFLRLDMALGVRLHLDLEQQPEEDRWWLNKCLGEDAILTTSCKQNNFFHKRGCKRPQVLTNVATQRRPVT